MLYPEDEGFYEEIVKIGQRAWYTRWYWLLVLWVAAVGVFTGIGYYMDGAGASSRLLVAMSEAWSNMFAPGQKGFVEVIDTNKFSPRTSSLGEVDRVFTGSADTGRPEVAGVTTGQMLCEAETESAPLRDKIIINEVAWMGGLMTNGLDARDEWIELKNISTVPVNISGWQLQDDDGQIQIVFPKGTLLPPGGFYLLERTDDGSVPEIATDLVYVGSLANEDDGLRLFNANCQLEDEVLTDPNWPAGNAAQRRTMERDPDLSWHTFGGSAGEIILGTPKAENSVPAVMTEEEEIELVQVESCPSDNLKNPTYEVLINEVAWAGMSGNASGEWIELYHSGETEMSLAGWQLLDKEGSIAVYFGENDFVDDYFLLRRILTTEDPTADYEVAGKKVDKAYTGVLQNSDEVLYLFNAECKLVDVVKDVGMNWRNVGGTASPDYRTAERTDENDWHTYSGSGREGVMGTPRASNSKTVSDYKDDLKPSGGGGDSTQKPDEPTINWCLQGGAATSTYAVFVNEVAWSGTASSTSAEWIELAVQGSEEISLSGWQLLDQDGEIKITFDGDDKIEDYFLLARRLADDDPGVVYTIGGVVADKTYIGVLQNSEETLRLFDGSCDLIDEVIDVGDNWGNIGGTASPDYRTAERVGTGNWQTYIGEGTNGVMGTPRAWNSKVENPPEEGEPPNGGGEEPPPEEEEPPEENEGIDFTNLQITEIVFDIGGAGVADDGLERVTISNSTSTDVLIEDRSLQYLKEGDEFTTIKKKNFVSGNTVPANGDFVVGMSCSTATPCEGADMSWSQSLANDGGTVYLVSNQEVITGDDDPEIVHQLSYGSG